MTDAAIDTAAPPMNARLWALLLLLGALWGGSFFFVAVAVHEIPPLTLVLLRVGIAAAALQLFLALRGPSFRLALPYLLPFFGLAMLNNVIPFSLMFTGQTAIGAGLASVLNATTPFWTLILVGYVFRTETPVWNKLAGTALGIAGTALMIGPGLVAGLGGPAWAKLALIGTALSYAFSFVVARRFRALPPAVVATGQLTASTIIMLPLAFTIDGAAGFGGASWTAWACVLGLALLATALAYIIFFELTAQAGSSNASLVTMIVPVVAILLGAFVLRERLEAFELAGMAVIGLGLVVIDGRFLPRR